jgi:hypothetical protein
MDTKCPMPLENHAFEPQFYSKILPTAVYKIYIFTASSDDFSGTEKFSSSFLLTLLNLCPRILEWNDPVEYQAPRV